MKKNISEPKHYESCKSAISGKKIVMSLKIVIIFGKPFKSHFDDILMKCLISYYVSSGNSQNFP